MANEFQKSDICSSIDHIFNSYCQLKGRMSSDERLHSFIEIDEIENLKITFSNHSITHIVGLQNIHANGSNLNYIKSKLITF